MTHFADAIYSTQWMIKTCNLPMPQFIISIENYFYATKHRALLLFQVIAYLYLYHVSYIKHIRPDFDCRTHYAKSTRNNNLCSGVCRMAPHNQVSQWRLCAKC